MEQTPPRRPFDSPDEQSVPRTATTMAFAQSEIERLVLVIRRRRGLILALIALGTALSVVAGAQVQPSYTARASLVIDPQQTRVAGQMAVAEDGRSDRTLIDTKAKLLASEEHLSRVAARLVARSTVAQQATPGEARPAESPLQLRVAESWKELVAWLPDSWLLTTGLATEAEAGAGAATNGVIPEGGRIIDIEDTELARRTAAMARQIQVTQDGRSMILNIDYTDASPRRAARVANLVAHEFVARSVEQKRQGTAEARAWLEQRVGDFGRELEQAETAVEQFRQENDLLESNGIRSSDLAMSELGRDMIATEAELNEKRDRLETLRRIWSSGGDVSVVPDVITSPVYLQLWRQQLELDQRETTLRSTYSELHPQIQAVLAERQTLAGKIEDEVRRVIGNLENEVGLLASRLASLEKAAGIARGDTFGDRTAMLRLRELERHAEALRNQYEGFLARYQETREQELILQPDARVVSRAATPQEPSSFGLVFFGFMGLTLSSAFAVAIALLSDQLDRRLRSGRELESAFGLTCLSLLPKLSDRELKRYGTVHRYVIANPNSMISEAIGMTFAQMCLMRPAHVPKVIQVTSSVPGEGKSSFAASFATSLALSGRKTILLDLDLRRPSLVRDFDVPEDDSLVGFLSGEAVAPFGGYVDEEIGLEISGLRQSLRNPSAALDPDRLKVLLAQLGERCESIVIDSPPVLGMRDSRLISSVVDAVVFLVRWESTSRDFVGDAIKQLREVEAPIVGAALSIVDVRRQARYGYGGSDGYLAKYRHYYDA